MYALARLLFITALSMARSNTSEPSSEENKRIVGGSDVPENEHIPYQVSMQYKTDEGLRHFCGGSIITPNRILTAAHCCDGLNTTRMSVLAGVRNLDDRHGVRSKVLSCTIHPDYKILVTSDIAVLSIDPPLKYSKFRIAPISVEGKEFVGDNVPVTLTGWGRRLPISIPLLDILNYPNSLQRMSYHTISNKQCRESGMEKVTDTEICARGIFRGSCSGDSGGPLVTRTSKGVHQVGIVSYGLSICGLSITPDVYTRVSTFSDWIQSEITK
ncbi:chymotrypsin-1 [Scaptodrosophila lebanonensis]|uniref:trypsin n=1 Tax=Drosophila lebanonensis TaxID=7225 RepID=A0A6J2THR6_DROLE|nr:chymotrypsin-1 [Scaptodrosophila lebanonensis]